MSFIAFGRFRSTKPEMAITTHKELGEDKYRPCLELSVSLEPRTPRARKLDKIARKISGTSRKVSRRFLKVSRRVLELLSNYSFQERCVFA